MKKLINHPDHVVDEMVDGLLALHPDQARIAGQNVVVRSDSEFDPARTVSLISGGGSGHEPAHAGYVGRGMLSAAVPGPVFTSPTATSVYAAIKAVGGGAGVLLIVKNYTGDRLNFGFAAERARAEGVAVETAIVADDVALLQQHERADARGIAGTIFVHKIAGAAAQEGLPLSEVAAIARSAADDIGSIGLSLSAGTSPVTGLQSFVLADDELELGLGIHGEPGVNCIPVEDADSLVRRLVEPILDARRIGAGDRVAALVNNLGSTTPMEVAIASNSLSKLLRGRGISVERLYAGTFLTSLDMAGISISLMRVDDQRLAWLDAGTAAPAWPNVVRKPASDIESRTIRSTVRPGESRSTRPVSGSSTRMRKAIGAACQAAIDAEAKLTALDREVGDGDLGNNLARSARAVQSALDELPLQDPAAVLREIGVLLEDALGGSSGPLYGVLFLKAAAALNVKEPGNLKDWAVAIEAGCAAISELGGAQLGDRTMLDALLPFAGVLSAKGAEPQSQTLLKAALTAAEAAARTATMVPRRGRSRYLGQRALGHPDPGAVGVSIWLGAIATALTETAL